MARIASQSKGGYYPTPLDELKYINQRLKTSEGRLNIIDPCCGTGQALGLIGQHLKSLGAEVETYGVELEESRAMEAVIELDHVIHDGYEHLRTEPKYSLLFLNPPYQDGFGERVETTFLRSLTGYKNVLQDEGLLVYIIPQHVLDDSAGVLSSRFSDIRVYRFTDKNYDLFKQVVVFGRFKRPDPEEKKRNGKRLKELAKEGKNALPTLDTVDDVCYELYPSDPVTVFRAGRMNDYELQKDLMASPILEEAHEIFSNKIFEVTFERPILELKPMHYSVATMADTDRGGNMGDHYLVSSVVKKKHHQENYDDEGRLLNEEFTEYYQSRIGIFSKDGVFDLE